MSSLFRRLIQVFGLAHVPWEVRALLPALMLLVACDDTCSMLASDQVDLTLVGFPNPAGTGPDECGQVTLVFPQNMPILVDLCSGWSSQYGRVDIPDRGNTWECEGDTCEYQLTALFYGPPVPSEVIFRYVSTQREFENTFPLERLPPRSHSSCATNPVHRLGLTVHYSNLP